MFTGTEERDSRVVGFDLRAFALRVFAMGVVAGAVLVAMVLAALKRREFLFAT